MVEKFLNLEVYAYDDEIQQTKDKGYVESHTVIK